MPNILDNPNITDIGRISEMMAGLKALSTGIAAVLIVFLFVLEAINQTMKTAEGRSNYTGLFFRTGLVFLGLILYETIFNFIVGAGRVIEMSVLSEKEWGDFLSQITFFYENNKVRLMTGFPTLFTWLASFAALLTKTVLYWIRFTLLSLLYFVGPIVFVFAIYKPTSFMVGKWFEKTIQLSLWMVTLKIMMRVMLELQVMTYLTGANSAKETVTLIAIDSTFIVLILLSPHFTARLISGETFGPMAVLASTIIATKGLQIAQTVGSVTFGHRFPAGHKAASSANTPTMTKTAQRDALFKRGDGRGHV